MVPAAMYIPSPDGYTPMHNSAHGIVEAIKYAQMDLFFGAAYVWDNEILNGFLACPSGFLVVQFIASCVDKELNDESAEDIGVGWTIRRDGTHFGLPRPHYGYA
eukprot:GEMP01102601.1.p1 GENE.GEMP01102601.1~~GEMP01102601.1.p1  ORF type:complete len:104 (+),score=25.91 GEMP01102601.1:97-408(+)